MFIYRIKHLIAFFFPSILQLLSIWQFTSLPTFYVIPFLEKIQIFRKSEILFSFIFLKYLRHLLAPFRLISAFNNLPNLWFLFKILAYLSAIQTQVIFFLYRWVLLHLLQFCIASNLLPLLQLYVFIFFFSTYLKLSSILFIKTLPDFVQFGKQYGLSTWKFILNFPNATSSKSIHLHFLKN